MKYLKLEITRTEGTDIYVKVPDDFDHNALIRAEHAGKIGRIAKETVMNGEWDNYGWEENIEVQSIKVVPESEATQYAVGELA